MALLDDARVLLPLFKTEHRITTTREAENENLTQKMVRSMSHINWLMGSDLDFVNDLEAQELLFNRVRYDYNSFLEEWSDNFQIEILTLQLKYATDDGVVS